VEEREDYKIRLEIFEGPLDLLIHLIRKNEVDIFDIPIALITDQYLAYINMMKALNINVAGDFLVMAATLIHIKSRLLLPGRGEDGEEVDPREEITRPLLEYLQFKDLADDLSERQVLERMYSSVNLTRIILLILSLKMPLLRSIFSSLWMPLKGYWIILSQIKSLHSGKSILP
jgi:chromatin segregation and condensation protein Rec8/ScpA/Scc1 (kleisin family)